MEHDTTQAVIEYWRGTHEIDSIRLPIAAGGCHRSVRCTSPGHRGKNQGPWKVPRRESGRRFSGSRRLRLPSSQLCEESRTAAIPVVYFLHGYGVARRDLLEPHVGSEAADQDLSAPGPPSEMIIVLPGCLHRLRRQHVLELAHHRRLGNLHHRGPDQLHRQPLPHHRQPREPRALRGTPWEDTARPHRHEASGSVLRDLRHEFLLPDEQCHQLLPAKRAAGKQARPANNAKGDGKGKQGGGFANVQSRRPRRGRRIP